MRMTPVERAQSLPSLAPASIIAVASGKGGVGKTWFSVTLAHALGIRGRRALLFDADMGLANVDVQLGLMPERDITRAVIDGLPLREAVSRAPGGRFDVIAGRSGSGAMSQLGPAQLDRLARELVELAPAYDTVVLDLGAGVEAPVLRMAGAAGRCMVIVTDEPTSLTDGYAFIKVARARFPQLSFEIVVNMAESVREGQRSYGAMKRACESFLKFTPPLAGIVRRDPKVKDSIRRQTPTLTCHPGSPACADVEAIAAAIAAAGGRAGG
jgi:flagellar biosynthesis protein FlhG